MVQSAEINTTSSQKQGALLTFFSIRVPFDSLLYPILPVSGNPELLSSVHIVLSLGCY
jgi:hypothetical protein